MKNRFELPLKDFKKTRGPYDLIDVYYNDLCDEQKAIANRILDIKRAFLNGEYSDKSRIFLLKKSHETAAYMSLLALTVLPFGQEF